MIGPTLKISDPYILPGSPVKLDGLFKCLTDIEIVNGKQQARFKLQETKNLQKISHFITPAILIDALSRLAILHVTSAKALPICVPTNCGRLGLVPCLNDYTLNQLQGELVLSSAPPCLKGDFIHNEWAQATDSTGQPVLTIENLVARRFGEIQDAI